MLPCPKFPSKGSEMAVELKNETQKCYFRHNGTHETSNTCRHRGIRLEWDVQTGNISFLLERLQVYDAGNYTCEVSSIIPPPAVFVVIDLFLGIQQSVYSFSAIPLVHVNHVEDPNGASVILCSSVGFYPGDLLQVLLMNGQVLNTTNLHREKIRNPDGTFTLNTRLHLSEKVPENVTYSCRVNHTTMSANQVITQNKCHALMTKPVPKDASA
uniref:Immunoglobulin C1-set domain-containing protein n=1 Tax=Denticeps clupeoides TaxID=299321 RepID=A0AAY4EM72_9TELE